MKFFQQMKEDNVSQVAGAYKKGYDSFKKLDGMEVVGIVEAAVQSDGAKFAFIQGSYDAHAGFEYGTHLSSDERATQAMVDKGIPIIVNNKGSQFRMLKATQTEEGRKIALDIVLTFVDE